jgi:hypothetical protein
MLQYSKLRFKNKTNLNLNEEISKLNWQLLINKMFTFHMLCCNLNYDLLNVKRKMIG